MKLFISSLILALIAPTLIAQTLQCQIAGSDDIFLLYPEQKLTNTDDFYIYQNFNGLVITTVNTQTMNFNRISHFNLLPEPLPLDNKEQNQDAQLISGLCEIVAS